MSGGGRFHRVYGGRVFTCTMSSGAKYAGFDQPISVESSTQRKALDELANQLEMVASEIRALARKVRS